VALRSSFDKREESIELIRRLRSKSLLAIALCIIFLLSTLSQKHHQISMIQCCFLDVEDVMLRVIIIGVILSFRHLTQQALQTVSHFQCCTLNLFYQHIQYNAKQVTMWGFRVLVKVNRCSLLTGNITNLRINILESHEDYISALLRCLWKQLITYVKVHLNRISNTKMYI